MKRRALIMIEGHARTGLLFIQGAQRLGLHPITLSTDPARYDYLAAESIETIRVDTDSLDALIHECSRLRATYNIAGITAAEEEVYATVGKLCRYFDLPGPNPASIERCCDKFIQRQLLAEAGVPMPAYRLAANATEVESCAVEIGLPVIIKPAVGSGSIGVRLCRNVDELAEHTTVLMGGKQISQSSPKILVEEFAEGPFYGADMMGNEVIAIAAADFGSPPYFVFRECIHPAPLTQDKYSRIAEISQSCLRALGLGWGPTNIEFRWTKLGPVVIEVNPRLPGGTDPQLVQLAYGVDLVTEHIKGVIGGEWDLRKRRAHTAAVRYLIADGDGTLDWIDGDSRAAAMSGVSEVKFYVDPKAPIVRKGDHRDRIGHVIAASPNHARTEAILQRAVNLISWSISPSVPLGERGQSAAPPLPAPADISLHLLDTTSTTVEATSVAGAPKPVVTEVLASYAAGLRFDDLPVAVVEATKLLILDNVGCALAGSQTTMAGGLRSYLEAFAGEHAVTVFGSVRSLPAPLAAWANAYAVTLLSFDDSYVRLGHPGASTIPGAIAVAEELGSSGRDLIAAIVAGYEVSLRIGAAIRPSSARAARVLGLATWQIFGAAVAAARLHELDRVRIADVFGLASQHAPVPFLRKLHGRPMGWLKNNYGWATMGAITAAALAARGFVGSRAVLDGETGFWIMAGSDHCDDAEMTRGLGAEYRLLNVGFKPYGCCRWAHTALDALRHLIAVHGIAADDVATVEVWTFSELVNDFFGLWPQSIVEAQFHLPYLMALELAGRSSASGLSGLDVDDPVVRSMAGRITGHLLAGADEKFQEESLLPVRLVLRGRDGSVLTAEAERPTGAAGGPSFGRIKVIDKFMILAEPVLGPAAGLLCDRILGLDDQSAASVFALARPSRE